MYMLALLMLLAAGIFCILCHLIIGVIKRSNQKDKAEFDARIKELAFIIHKEVEYNSLALYVDDTNKKWIARARMYDKEPRIFDFEDIMDFELYDDGNSIMRSGFGGALVGGAAFGVQGAMTGAIVSRGTSNTCAAMQVVIRLNNLDCPHITFRLVFYKIGRNSLKYNTAFEAAQKFMSVLTYMQNNKNGV